MALSLSPASRSGASAVNGTGVDTKCIYDEALVVLDIGAMAGGATLDVIVEEADNSTTVADTAGTYAAVSGAVFAQKLAASHASKLFVGRLDLRGRKRWLRAVGTDAAAAVVYAVQFILLGCRILPVTQDQTVGFNVADA